MASNQDVEDRLRSALADRYTIEREIGSGGMAKVYLAEDLKHHRHVALKVLKPELAAVLGAERFLAEIQTTAHLQHPNILPLFDSGEAGGQVFYVMPYVEGESLRERLDREKQLPVEEAVSIASEVAEALQVAHDDGVIHRDIKPANILLRKGKPVVADFGIALAVSAAGEGRLTETGLSLGTPYYMSPEQASADREPTPATDIYSLGCVLYEMLVGEPPYTGSTAQAILGKIMAGEPESVAAQRRSVPPNVDATIRKALEKLPADRFMAAQDFAGALADGRFRYDAPVTRLVATTSRGSRKRAWVVSAALSVGILAVGFGLGALWDISQGRHALNDTPVVVLMDTSAPSGVYDQETRDNSGTNADVLSDVLRDLPVVLNKEAVGSTWAREDQVLRQRPDLIIIHRSAFFHSMNLELEFGYPDDSAQFDSQRALRLYDYADNKLMAFFGFIGQGRPTTAFLVYSRGWMEDDFRADWVAQLEGRFPSLKGRVSTMLVPGGSESSTFRNQETAETVRQRVRAILGIESGG